MSIDFIPFLLHIACNISWKILIFYFPILSFPFCLPFCSFFVTIHSFQALRLGKFAHWRQHYIFTKKGLIMLNTISVIHKRQYETFCVYKFFNLAAKMGQPSLATCSSLVKKFARKENSCLFWTKLSCSSSYLTQTSWAKH